MRKGRDHRKEKNTRLKKDEFADPTNLPHPQAPATATTGGGSGGGAHAFFGGGPFAFFVAGVALLAIAYRASRRQGFGAGGATAAHAALQPQYSPSSPRITYDHATAAAASVAAAQHQQQHRGKWGRNAVIRVRSF